MRRIAFLILALFYCGLLLPAALRAQEPETPRPTGVPVVFQGKTLFSVYSNLASYRPAERAQIITVRLQNIADAPDYRSESLIVVERGDRSEILMGDVNLVTITEEDAQAAGQSRRDLAQAYVAIIRQTLETYRHEHSVRGLLLALLYAFLATLGLFLSLTLLHRAGEGVAKRVRRARHATPPTVAAAREIDDFFTVHFARPLLQLITFFRLALFAALLYGYLLLLLNLFPQTRPYAVLLQGSLFTNFAAIGTAFLTKLPDLLLIVVIVLVTNVALRIAHLFFSGIETQSITFTGLDPELAAPTYRLLRILIVALAVVAAFPYIPGSDSPAFRGISVLLGALVTLGSSSISSNLLAGIVLTYTRPFRIGDRVQIGETTGDVIAKSDLATRVRTVKNEEITLPNSLILGAHIRNYSAAAATTGLILHTSVTIGYDIPWRRVHELLIDATRGAEHILPDPPPFVLQTVLNDFSVAYEINAHTDRPDRMAAIYSALHQNIQDRFNEAGIEIMSPQYTSLRDGNKPTIPESYRGDQAAPPFRIHVTQTDIS